MTGGSSISVYYIGPIGLLAMPVYMKRSEPLVDAVRKSWELNADLHQFFLRNPAWTKRIESLLKEAVPGLGLKADQRRNIQAGAEGAFLPQRFRESRRDIWYRPSIHRCRAQ